jgi:hypothetical protein
MAKRANPANIIVNDTEDTKRKATRITEHYWNRSWQSRWNRRAQNLQNWAAYHSRQDWSGKLPWQTTQTITAFGISIEQSVGTLERGLTDTEDWLTVDPIGIGDPVMDADTIAALLKYYLQRLWVPGDAPETSYNLANLLGDGLKRALLESVITAKVYGKMDTKYQYRLVESKPVRGPTGHRDSLSLYDMTELSRPQKIVRDEVQNFRLAVELVPWEDWFPDPSLLNHYVIHEVTMDISDLGANPDYDPDVVKNIRGNAFASYSDMYKRVTQDVVFVAHEPYEVRVRECWGDLIDPDTSEVLATNSFWTVCNGQLLRPPTPNPFWHGKRPFVSAALLRTPNSTVHKALADDAVNTWQFLNELISLMFDGALASVWGKGQLRSDYVENAEDFQEGIPQAATFLLRPNTPEGYKAYEKIDSGELPEYAVKMFDLAMRELQTALATNDLKLGQQPPKEATATSVVEAMQASGSLFEAIAARVEDTFLDPLFELAWMTILQYETDGKFVEPVLVQILGPERVLQLTQMTNEERFHLLSTAAKFKCRGLRGVTSRSRVLTKLANLLQLFGQAPEVAQAFQQKYSMQRLTEQLIRNSGVDPSTLEKTQEEKDADEAQQMAQDAMMQAQATPPGAPGPAPTAGPPGTQPGPAGAPPVAPQPNGGSPAALVNASQDQMPTGAGGMAPKTPGGQIPGAPQT